MSPTVTILSELYYPEEISSGRIITRIAEQLAKQFRVTVITGPATKRFIRQSVKRVECINGVTVYRCKGTTLLQNYLVFRLLNSLIKGAAILFQLIVLPKSSVTLVLTNPPFLPFLARLGTLFSSTKLVVLVHDFYPDALCVATGLSQNSMLVRFWRYLNRNLFMQAAAVVVLGRDVKSRIIESARVDPHRLELIPNWAETERIKPKPRSQNAILLQLNIMSKLVILYNGNLGRTHNVKDIIDLIEYLHTNKEVFFLISSFGAGFNQLRKLIAYKRLYNVHIVTADICDNHETILNAGDIHLISYLPGMTGISVPSRMYSSFAAGKPILAAVERSSELGLVLQQERVGWVVSPGDIEGMARIIESILHDRSVLVDMGLKARNIAEELYAEKTILPRYNDLISRIISGK